MATTSFTGRMAALPSWTTWFRCAGCITDACTRKGGICTSLMVLPLWSRLPDHTGSGAIRWVGTRRNWLSLQHALRGVALIATPGANGYRSAHLADADQVSRGIADRTG